MYLPEDHPMVVCWLFLLSLMLTGGVAILAVLMTLCWLHG